MLGRSALAVLTVLTIEAAARADRLDLPVQRAWPAAHSWDAAAEADYSNFVAALGRGAAAGRCHTLAACLNDPGVNPLLTPSAHPLHMHADCADVPYMLRAYFAFQRGLPFVWASHMEGQGRDSRYYREARPVGLRTWHVYPTARRLLEHIGNEVNSGWFRTAPDLERTDTYPARIDRHAIRAGTMFYDPNGHVLVVYGVRSDGEVLFFDGHPDGSLTHTSLNGKQVVGGPRQGGGFRNFRPFVWHDGRADFATNANLPDYDPVPASLAARRVGGKRLPFVDWVRSQLAAPAPPANRT